MVIWVDKEPFYLQKKTFLYFRLNPYFIKTLLMALVVLETITREIGRRQSEEGNERVI